MRVYAAERGRESPIRNLEHLDGTLIIEGGENGRGWTVSIAEETGKMSSAISIEEEAFIIFGGCTVP
jgi:hypothetical protein